MLGSLHFSDPPNSAPNLWAIGFEHALVSFSMYYSLPRELTFGFQVGPTSEY